MEVKIIIINKPIKIYLEKDKFVFVKDNLNLILSKDNGDANIIKEYNPNITNITYSWYGIVSCIEAKIQKYMVYIDEVQMVGEILNSHVYRIKLFKYIPYDEDNISPEDFSYIQMINDFLGSNPLFYSDKIDLSLLFQQMRKRIEEGKYSPDSSIFRFSNQILRKNTNEGI